MELALYGAFGGGFVEKPWIDSTVLCIRVDEGFGLGIPTWPPEAEGRLAGIGTEGRRRWPSALESIHAEVQAETREGRTCTVSTMLLYV